MNFYLPIVALGIGATHIEKHITFDRAKKGVDYYFNRTNKIKNFIEIIRDLEKAFF